MAYDVRWEAPGALALGGVGALGGLAYSYLNKKQRNNKLRNALIGAGLLPLAYIGGKYIAGKILDKNADPDEGLEPSNVLYKDPMYKYISRPPRKILYDIGNYPASKGLYEHYTELLDAEKKRDILRKTVYRKQNPSRSELKALWSAEDTADSFNEIYLADLYNNGYARKEEESRLANTTAALGYGTLGAGITLPALYLAYLNKKKKKQQAEMA